MTVGTSHACTAIRYVQSPRRDAWLLVVPYCHGIARCARTAARPEGALTEDLHQFKVPDSPNCQDIFGPRGYFLPSGGAKRGGGTVILSVVQGESESNKPVPTLGLRVRLTSYPIGDR